MNILWISHNIPYPPKTGVLQRNYNLLREASKIGNIYLVAFFQKAVLPVAYDLEQVRRELGKLCRHIEIVPMPNESKLTKYTVVSQSIFTEDPFSINCLKSTQMQKSIRELASRVQFDVVHYDTISLAVYYGDVNGAARIMNHHNIESMLMERRGSIEKNFLKGAYYRMEAKKLKKYETENCGKFDVNFTVSGLDKEILAGLIPGKRIEVIANGVDTDYFCRKGIPEKPNSLIICSGMNWYPNRDAVIYMCNEIWPLLKKKYPDISMTVVGASPPKRLLDLAKSDKCINVTGFVDDVRPYLEEASVYLCPMRDGGGTRLKILDALSMAKPIVSTTIGCEGIDVTPGKNVLIADSPATFVEQIGRLLENPALRSSLGEEGRRLAEAKYSWKVIGSNLAKIYGDLTRQGRRHE